MHLFGFPRPRLSDEEYIAKIRRCVASLDRWRFWLILFQSILLCVIVWMFSKVIPILLGMVQPANLPNALWGFVIGAVFGITCGWMIYGVFHGLLLAISGYRTERLLLKHYDARNAIELEEEQPAKNEDNFKELHERNDSW